MEDPEQDAQEFASSGEQRRRSRQGRQEDEEFTSPWTGKKYQRWVDIEVKEGKEERTLKQSGLAAARAFETPNQRNLMKMQLEALKEAKVPEWKKYDPDLLPPEMKPPTKDDTILQRPRCTEAAGSWKELVKQLAVQTILDLRITKSETPIWYYEPCAGEGEYPVSVLREQKKLNLVSEPTMEDLYNILRSKNLSGMPPEINGWMDAVRVLNAEREGFEEKGSRVEDADIQWLPSSTFIAWRMLRSQDPISMYEGHPISFAALFNFVRNWSPLLPAKVELAFKNGIGVLKSRWSRERKKQSETHGRHDKQRGVVFIDPGSFTKATFAYTRELVVELRKNWFSATVMVAYSLDAENEKKMKSWKKSMHQADSALNLVIAEMRVRGNGKGEMLDEKQDTDTRSEWSGCGILISLPPHTTAERLQAALSEMIGQLQDLPNAPTMTLEVTELAPETKTAKRLREARELAEMRKSAHDSRVTRARQQRQLLDRIR